MNANGLLDDLAGCTEKSCSREDLWRRFVTLQRISVMAEVGVWKGEFAQFMLESCPSIERYYMIDPWAPLDDWNKPYNVDVETFSTVYSEALQRTAFAEPRRVVLRGTTVEIAAQIEDASLDLVYLDGDHTLRGVMLDLIRLTPKVKAGGFVCGDDFVVDPWHHGAGYEPTMVRHAAIYFAEAMGYPILGLPFNQFVIHAQPSNGYHFRDTTGEYGDLRLSHPGAGARLRRARRFFARALRARR